MEPINHFPWTTSMMVFVIDKAGRILLNTNNEGKWGTFRFNTTCDVDTGSVNIRQMVCDELYRCDILTSPECLKHQGILHNGGKVVFIYTAEEFATNDLTPSINSLWHQQDEILHHRLSDFERHVLIMICDRERIGIQPAVQM